MIVESIYTCSLLYAMRDYETTSREKGEVFDKDQAVEIKIFMVSLWFYWQDLETLLRA